jgi:hypothetical protein
VYLGAVTPSEPQEHGRKLRKAATDLWFAVERMGRRRRGPLEFEPDEDRLSPPPHDDDLGGGASQAGVPRRPAPSAGSAAASVDETEPKDV